MQLRICSVITLTLAVDKVVLQMLNWGNALIFLYIFWCVSAAITYLTRQVRKSPTRPETIGKIYQVYARR